MKISREATIKAELQGVKIGNSLRKQLEVRNTEFLTDVLEAIYNDLLNYRKEMYDTLKEGRSVTIEIYADLD